MTNKRTVKITFTDIEKRIDFELIASVISKKLLSEGGKNNVKRKKVL